MMKNILFEAIQAALEAGHEILKIYNDPLSDFGIEKKADNSPLTIADKKAHEVIVSHLAKTSFPILSEEGKMSDYNKRRFWETLWIVDPLDGTKEFIKKNGEFTVNIALVEKGIPVMGVIYVPIKKELYFAEHGLGAYKLTNIAKLEVQDTVDKLIARSLKLFPDNRNHNNLVIVASRSHLTPETESYIEEMKKKYSSVAIVSSGSSLKICLVAEGSADVYPRFAPTMEWDTAAGHAIAKAAGREIYCAGTNEPLQYNKEDLLNPWFIVEKARKED